MPIKINVFAWIIRLDKLPTRLNLSLKGIDITTIVCPLCHASVEFGSQIFFCCPMVQHLWRKLMRWWELEDIDLASYDDWLLWLNSSRFSKRLKEILEGVCYVKWNECYDNEDELQSFRHKARQQDKVYDEREESCWILHLRTGIFYLKGHEGVMNEVPDGAAIFASSYWLRNSDMYRV
ncbi:RNA-directed DNA polymerase, eukaryota [Tanacetum coccineum]